MLILRFCSDVFCSHFGGCFFSVFFSEPIKAEISKSADTLYLSIDGGVRLDKLDEFIYQLKVLKENLDVAEEEGVF